MKKVIAIIAAVACVAVMGVLLWNNKQEERAYTEQAKAVNQQLSDLQQQKKQLEQELEELESTEAEETTEGTEAEGETVEAAAVPASFNLIFTSMDNDLYDSMADALEDSSVEKMFAIGKKNFTDYNWCLTEYRVDKMLDAGWKTCLYWDGNDDVEGWYQYIDEMLEAWGVDTPNIVYCKEGTYSEDLESKFHELGIVGIINHGETGNTISLPGTYEDGTWYVGCCNWTTADTAEIENNTTPGQVFVYTVGNDDDHSYDTDSTGDLKTMLAQLAALNQEGQQEKVQFMALGSAVDQSFTAQQEQVEEIVEEEDHKASRIDEIKEELEQINKDLKNTSVK